MKFGLSKKIWSCIGILMLGYAFSVTRSLFAEREVRRRLTKIRLGLLPAQQCSQLALDEFNHLQSDFQSAVTFGERERLEMTRSIISELSNALTSVNKNAHLDSSERQRASEFLDRILIYYNKGSAVYEKMLDLGDFDESKVPMEQLRDLASEAKNLSSELNQWNSDRKELLSNNLTMISTRMQKETTLNTILLIGVTVLSGSIAYVIISSKIVGPINETVRLAQQIAKGNYGDRLAVKGTDEMSDLGRAFNRMTEKLENTLHGLREEVMVRTEAEDELKQLNEQLEVRVLERTEELSHVNESLNDSFATLKATQQQLVEVEKMASLGELVAGVAHEINTPVGVGVTVASHLKGRCDELVSAYKQNELKRSTLDDFVKDADEGVGMLLENLQRAASLIQSFKQVAVDQSSEECREIDVVEYVHEVVASLQPKLKRTNYGIRIEGAERIEATTYPGAIAQIITNLVTNSLIHGFEGAESGTICIRLSQPDDDRVEVEYTDDGIGMDKDTLDRVFNPFFTTKRGKGGSGLGMHIIYNLVTQSLDGAISCKSQKGEGISVVINFPRTIENASEAFSS